MTTQNILTVYPAIAQKLSTYYGWDKPEVQGQWTIDLLMKDGKNEWQAFSYLVEDCLTHTNDRELDFMWFEILKEKVESVRAA
ncbi:MAG: hypothetical protein CME71_05000 [Halobacteriovorax sp.]|nr:hypothetical protein [Halobacteriovorax sp.]